MKFYGFFKEGAIIQRDKPINVRGSVESKAICRLTGENYDEQYEVVPNEEGDFKVTFSPVSDIKNYFTLSLICGQEKIEVCLRFGDVILALGQSNMAYGAGTQINMEEILNDAANSDVAAFDIYEAYGQENGEIWRPAKPQKDYEKDWKWAYGSSTGGKTSGKDSFGGSSAVSLMTAIKLNKATGVPVGVINTALGGVSIDTYLPRDVADTDEAVKAHLIKTDKYIGPDGEYNIYGGANYTQLGGIYNEKIAPMTDCSVKAILWYQGENAISNFDNGVYFANILSLIIKTYRGIFGEDTFFGITHVALDYYYYGPNGYNYINEAIDIAANRQNALSFPAYDESTQWLREDGALYYHPIHPVDKRLIAQRFYKAIYTSVYQNKPWIPPYIGEVKKEGNKMICKVYPENIELRGRKVNGFTIAGKDGKYVLADAVITSRNVVEVSSPYVLEPEAITYAFSPYNQNCNLFTTNGDAVKPYRTNVEEVEGKDYVQLNAYSDCNHLFFDEKNFGIDLGCVGKIAAFKSGTITRTSSVRLSIEGRDDARLKVEYDPTNKGYFFFGVSPEVNIQGAETNFEKYRYMSVIIDCQGEDVELWGALVKENKGKTHRLTGEEMITKLEKGSKEYVISLEKFTEPDLYTHPSDKEALKNINTLEIYFRSQKKGTLYIEKIFLHD